MGELDVNQIYKKYFEERVSCLHHQIKVAENLQETLKERTNQKQLLAESEHDVWIFGYGSLVWKADFPFIDRRHGYICGFQRRFYQHSIDHRGTVEKPGRVVTLLPTGNDEDRVYGTAYRISAKQKHDVLSHLDYREKNGYERCTLQFYEFPEATADAQIDVIMYIAMQENGSYAGDIRELPSIAEQIFTSAGPSGPNRDYLFNLAHAMRALFPGVNDEHLFGLEREVLKRIEEDEAVILESALKKEIENMLARQKMNAANLKAFQADIEAVIGICATTGWRERLLTRELLLNNGSS